MMNTVEFDALWRIRLSLFPIYHSRHISHSDANPKGRFMPNQTKIIATTLCLYLVHPVGFEPTTNGFEDRYSSN